MGMARVAAKAIGGSGMQTKGMRAALLASAAALALVALVPAAHADTSFSYQTFGEPGGGQYGAYGITDNGTVVGYNLDYALSQYHPENAFLRNSSGVSSFYQYPGLGTSYGFGANDNGYIVGQLSNGYGNAFLYNPNAGWSQISYGLNTAARGINDANQIVGYSTPACCGATAFLDVGGTLTTITPPGSLAAWAYAISNDGKIAGYYENSQGSYEGFVDAAGSFTTVMAPGALQTEVFGINNAGQLVGMDYVGGAWHGFVDTNGVFMTPSIPGFSSVIPYGINDSGVITGRASITAIADLIFIGTPVASPDGVPLPVIGGTIPGGMILFGWLGRRLSRRKAGHAAP